MLNEAKDKQMIRRVENFHDVILILRNRRKTRKFHEYFSLIIQHNHQSIKSLKSKRHLL